MYHDERCVHFEIIVLMSLLENEFVIFDQFLLGAVLSALDSNSDVYFTVHFYIGPN